MPRYKNISGQDQHLIGFGDVEAGGIITTDRVINNNNFKIAVERRRHELPKPKPKAKRRRRRK